MDVATLQWFLLAELPVSFLPTPDHMYKCLYIYVRIYVYRCGWSRVVGSHNSGGVNTWLEVTLPNGPICALDTKNVANQCKTSLASRMVIYSQVAFH